MHRTTPICFVAIVTGTILGAIHADAQLNPFGWAPNGARLTSDDWRMVWQSTDALNGASPANSGEAREWNNPQSGNSGTVTLERVFRSNDMPCHALLYSVMMAAQDIPQTYHTTWCQTETGAWKMLP
jgi:surface antigen